MPEQLNLLAPDGAAPPEQPRAARSGPGRAPLALFMALFPPPEAAAMLAARADDLREQHGLRGKRLETSRLHVSLHSLGVFTGALPEAEVNAAIAAAASVSCPPLHLVFDRALSFAGSDAFALRCDAASDKAIEGLRQRLALALKRVGHRPEPSRTPHITLLYDERGVAEQAIEPIAWPATEFVLVLSHVGRTHHEWLARWPLTGER